LAERERERRRSWQRRERYWQWALPNMSWSVGGSAGDLG
jgi:hypothetical protein